MFALKSSTVAAVTIGILTGCSQSGHEAGAVGHWTVDPGELDQRLGVLLASNKAGATPEEVAAMKRQLAKATIDLHADKSCVYNSGTALNGTWTCDDSTGKLTMNIQPLAVPLASGGPLASDTTAVTGTFDSTDTHLTMDPAPEVPPEKALALVFDKR